MKQPSRRRTAGKAGAAQEVATLEEIPNVGPAVAADLRRLGITSPADLLGRDPYVLYEVFAEMVKGAGS
jgi:predicted flap endonuclease-1-like 5' DNA nuclease